MTPYEKLLNCLACVRAKTDFVPDVALILGSGLGALADEIDAVATIDYHEIEGFPVSTVVGHKGRFVFGYFGNTKVVIMQGRVHYYEGYSREDILLPTRLMILMGAKALFLTNAAGGVNRSFQAGDFMLITDHINFFPEHPLRGKNFPTGPRFPDMSEPYDRQYLAMAREIAREKGIKTVEGVYVGTQGPTFETPAEYKMYRIIGGDAVGMSTVPEVIVARHCGIRTFGISIITDLGVEGKIVEVSHEEVQKAADAVQPLMAEIFRTLVQRIAE
jgi:purine-nucleoside phosphorylase